MAGGGVSAVPPPNCTGGKYTSGTVVTLTPTPASTYAFNTWSGDNTTGSNPLLLTMTADKSVTSNFSQVCYTLTTASQPSSGGSVQVSPAPNCSTDKYVTGTVVTLTPTPADTYACPLHCLRVRPRR